MTSAPSFEEKKYFLGLFDFIIQYGRLCGLYTDYEDLPTCRYQRRRFHTPQLKLTVAQIGR